MEFRDVSAVPAKHMNHGPKANWRKTARVAFLVLATQVAVTATPQPAPGLAAADSAPPAQIVFLGTGYPRPDPQRQGPALAVVVRGKAYLVDAGVGLVRQAQAAADRGIDALQPNKLDIAFITHLHSDHTLGLPDLILTPWVQQRTFPLELFGPSGIGKMAGNILKAYEKDIHIRVSGLEGDNPTGYIVHAHRVRAGLVYQDPNVKVTAFAVKHGTWREAYGYRFDTPSKSIVLSGDTAPADSVVDACQGCDVMIHEVYSGSGGVPGKDPDAWMKYMAAFHTSAQELGKIATRARPKRLVLTHYIFLGPSDEAEMVGTIKREFKGEVFVARDLDVITP